MARPKKADNERIEDAFFDMPASEQRRLLGTLNTLHRLKVRQAGKEFTQGAAMEAAIEVIGAPLPAEQEASDAA